MSRFRTTTLRVCMSLTSCTNILDLGKETAIVVIGKVSFDYRNMCQIEM